MYKKNLIYFIKYLFQKVSPPYNALFQRVSKRDFSKRDFQQGLFLFFLFLFIIFLFALHFGKLMLMRKNGFENFAEHKNNNIILLGDSILNNKKYVGLRESVPELFRQVLTEKNIDAKIYLYAEDNAYINDVYYQLDKLPYYLTDNNNSVIFLSIGGNDLLGGSNLDEMFLSYKKLVESIYIKFPNTKLILLDLYNPYILSEFNNNHSFSNLINIWNNKLYEFVPYFKSKISNNNKYIQIFKISNYLNDEKDFVNKIEPSYFGGIKIAQFGLQYI